MTFSGEERIYIWLDSFPLEEQEKQKLLKAAESPKKLLSDLAKLFPSVIKSGKESVYNTMADSLKDGGAYFRSVLEALEQNGVTPIPYPSKLYPEPFKTLPSPPLVLYAKGDVSLLQTELFAIVGSRITPQTAMRTGKTIAKDLSERFTLLTGTADGGDTAAIEGGLSGSGKIVCFAAGGLNALPKNNAPLLDKVLRQGLILTACPPNTPVRSFSFERRNELLATLCKGALVLSAGEKSGALITAKYVQKASKPLFALPYPPESPAGAGCNGLIKQGARLTERANDIFSFFGIKETLTEKKTLSLTEDENTVITALNQEHEISLSLLAAQTKIPAYKLAGIVTALEVKGLIVKTGGNKIALI